MGVGRKEKEIPYCSCLDSRVMSDIGGRSRCLVILCGPTARIARFQILNWMNRAGPGSTPGRGIESIHSTFLISQNFWISRIKKKLNRLTMFENWVFPPKKTSCFERMDLVYHTKWKIYAWESLNV